MRLITKWLAVLVLFMTAAGSLGCDTNGTDPAESTGTDGNRGTSAGRPGPGQ